MKLYFMTVLKCVLSGGKNCKIIRDIKKQYYVFTHDDFYQNQYNYLLLVFF